MKRSEMIDYIEQIILLPRFQDDTFTVATDILKGMEDQGILPPPIIYKCFNGVEDDREYKWEPENE